ncbi:MAG: phytoene/squalene synthase family protein [Bacteroidales bacterium]|nr:phytoene/squalene synthase family protein [Bacteroidales bacterium]
MLKLFTNLSYKVSKVVTNTYSTSFSVAVRFLDKDLRKAIYGIYGFVRLADEIVDSFHNHDKKFLLDKFENDYYDALKRGISLNPVLNSFQETVRLYHIPDGLVKAFLKSMKLDLIKNDHVTKDETDEYIYGSAEAVGLMCLKVFTGNDEKLYEELKQPAKRLGAAFQKVNFLRDLKDDTLILNRRYFHNITGNEFNEKIKQDIIDDIENDFDDSVTGLKRLPADSKTGVLIAYYYYKRLMQKIRRTPAEKLLEARIRVSGFAKFLLLIKSYVVSKLKLF